MPTEVSEFIGGLDASKPQGSETLGEADDHIRLTKANITQTFLGDGGSDLWDTALDVGPRYLNSLVDDFTPDNYVKLDGAQTITGQKTITAAVKGDIGLVNDDDANLISQTGAAASVGNYASPLLALTDSAVGLTQVYDAGGSTAVVLNEANWKAFLVDTMYAVGDFLFSSSPANPVARFPGTTWVAVAAGRFLASIGSHVDSKGDMLTIVAGDVAIGTKNHQITEDEMASHTHNFFASSSPVDSTAPNVEAGNGGKSFTYQTSEDGGDESHNNVPPGYGAYFWERTA